MGGNDEQLKGFCWKGGSERETTGILIWNQAFVVPGPDHKDVAVVLMDTQGAFDSQSTVKEGLTIFALSTMISSVQVYNITQNLQEDDLHHLQFFSEYGRLAKISSENTNTDSNSTEIKPFQTLMFLVRDWDHPSECPYGEEGGKMLLDKRLNVTEKMNKDLKDVRQDIKDCFKQITCFLMPYPGKKVTTNPKYDGKILDMDTDFREQLSELVPLLLAPKNLVIKSINGSAVTAKDLFQYFKTYMKICESGELPQPQSLLEATAEVSNKNEKDKALEKYKNDMNKVCGLDQPYLSPDILYNEHENYKEKAITKFKEARKMGAKRISDIFFETLKKEITSFYEYSKKLNEEVKKEVAKNQNDKAVKEALGQYNKLKKKALKQEQPYLFPESLQSEHTAYMGKAINLFDEKAKGGEELIEPYREQLENLIETSYENFQEENYKKANYLDIAANNYIKSVFSGGTISSSLAYVSLAAVNSIPIVGGVFAVGAGVTLLGLRYYKSRNQLKKKEKKD